MIAQELYDALMDPNATEEHREMLWSLVEGEARQVIDDAKAYKIEVVNKAKARSDYFKQILPEYRKNPKLVLEQAYIDTVKQVLQNVGETYIVEPTENGEIRIQVYRNPNYKKEILNKQDQTEQ
jgi:regulator of protease activity HflC (stomatin/prohibitin superfamily)